MKLEEHKRLERVRVLVDEMLLTMNDAEERRSAYIHLYGVSESSALLALKRGLDPCIATIAGMLHDYYRYKTGVFEFHDQKGAEAARPLLQNMGIFSEEEIRTIVCAISHHSDKGNTHTPYDEVLKDADTLQFYLYNVKVKVLDDNRVRRIKKILNELAIAHDSGLES